MTNTLKQHAGFRRNVIAIALLAAFAPAHAADEAPVGSPESSLSAGLGFSSGNSKDRALFGQYNGLRNNGANLLLDADIRKRDDETGTWTTFQGRNLGLDSREFGATYQKQGDWKLSADYSELVRHDPRTINTSLQGAGTTTPIVSLLPVQGSGADLNLELKRKGVSVAAEKWLSTNLLFEASFKNEDKDGARLFGAGIACGVYASQNNTCGQFLLAGTTGAILLLPEPVNSNTKQFEAKLNYSGEKFNLSGGYYGSFFTNANGSLNTTLVGGLSNPNGTAANLGAVNVAGDTLASLLQQPLALPPDNQAHQLSLAGNYAFTPSTRATFKLAYTHATQNEDFGSTGLTAPGGVGNLGGVVNRTLAQVGLTARPIAKLSLNANLRYEDKKDKTPYGQLHSYTISQNSSTKLTGKLEASYRLPDNYRATVGVDYQAVDRDRPVGTLVPADPGFSGLREQTEEVGYRAELRRSMSDTLNASIGYGQSRREGSDWLLVGPALTAAAPGSFPTTKQDRKRDKVKVSADWTPLKTLFVQLTLEDGKDRYSSPSVAGLRDTGVTNYGLDAVWTLSDSWKLTGYWNQGSQTLRVNHLPAQSFPIGYTAELKNVSTSLDFGVVGKPSKGFEVGGDLLFMNDSNRYQLGGGNLPDVTYRVTRLNVFGKYELEKNADLRLDLVHQRAKLDEWTWSYGGTPFAYSDNTTVSLQPNQSVTFLGVSYIYKMK